MGFFKKMKDMQAQGAAMQQQAMAGAGMPGGGVQDALAARGRIEEQGHEYRRLAAIGLSGNAVIKDARDTGERVAGNAILDLDLVVTMDGGEPYTTTLNYMIAGADMSPYQPGASYSVKIDPEDRSKLTFG